MPLWLDVEKGRDTTRCVSSVSYRELWLDVEKGRDTTRGNKKKNQASVVA